MSYCPPVQYSSAGIAAGSDPCASALEPSASQLPSDDLNGQFDSGGVHKQARWHSQSSTVEHNFRFLRSGRRYPSAGTGQTHSRGIECVGGFVVSSDDSESDRVEVEPSSVPVGVRTVTHTVNRLVCHEVQQSTAVVCVSNPRPICRTTRCARVRLGRDGRLRLSADSADTTDSAQVPPIHLSDHTDRAIVAESDVVSGPSGVGRPSPTSTAREVGSADPPSHTTVPLRSRSVSFTRMDTVKRNLRAKGYARRSTVAYLRMHRDSTSKAYDARWVIFTKWCKKHRITKPDSVSLPTVARFMSHLREARRLSGGTIANYVSGLATVRDVATGTCLAKEPVIRGILKGFKQQDLKKSRLRPPAWDLNLVLRSLTKAPYEPLSDASVQHVTWKTAFLLAFATAARVSELHALDVSRVRFDRGDIGAVRLGLLPGFVAKNQTHGQAERDYTIRSLTELLGPDDTEDSSLCPVRALKQYIKVTRERRKGRTRLFISVNPKREADITRNSISLWLRSVVNLAYRQTGVPARGSNPHEIRALAATFAFRSNVSIHRIVRGCFWATDSVFASHYLRDVSDEDVEGVHRLGPLIAAQSVLRR